MKIFSFTQGMLVALILSMSLVTLAQAHHGFAFEFDPQQQGTVTGVVTSVRFANPHVVYMIDVETADGATEEWLLRTHNVGVMRRQGWDMQLSPRHSLKWGFELRDFETIYDYRGSREFDNPLADLRDNQEPDTLFESRLDEGHDSAYLAGRVLNN